MVRLTHLTGSRAGQVDTSPKAVLRIGRGADCDIRFDPGRDRTVSTHHAEIRFEGDGYVLLDTRSSNGTFLNGRRILHEPLNPGDVIALGGMEGPQVRFELVEEYAQPAAPVITGGGRMPTGGFGSTAPGAKQPNQDDYDFAMIARDAAAKARAQREASGGQPSGQTMFVMIDAIQQAVEKKKSSWKKWVFAGGGLAAVIIAVLVTIVVVQHRQLAAKVDTKKDLDAEIAQIQAQLQLETDEDKLSSLVARLEMLSGQAASLTEDLSTTDRGRVAMKKAGIDSSGDFVEREIRKILRSFEADTYKIPKTFRDRVEHYIELSKKNSAHTRRIWERRNKYWPMIEQAFAEERVPLEMAYVAWVESMFETDVCSWVGARGMWQFMPHTGRRFNLRIDRAYDKCRPAQGSMYCDCGGTDERTDPYKSSKAGAQYLGALLSEFGSESFMLAIASYNKGEAGLRKILREKKLRTRAERDFWHLYYLKLLPEETMEYVPKIIAAAIIGNNPREFGLE